MSSDTPGVLLFVAILLLIFAGIFGLYPTFDFSAEVLFDTKATGASGKQWGILRYSTEGYDWEVNLRKSDAQDEMTKICAPMKYQILEANRISESEGIQIAGYGFDIKEPSMVIRFECLDIK